MSLLTARQRFVQLTFCSLALVLGASPAFAHDHGAQGRYGGQIIELGQEAFHAELVVDEKTGRVTVYVLDSDARELVLSECPEAVIDLKHGDAKERFVLKAARQKNEPQGSSSRYVIKDDELVSDLHSPKADPILRVKMAGKIYSGRFRWEHIHQH